MIGPRFIGIAIGVAVIVVVIVVYALMARRLSRRSGRRGLVQKSRLICPKCGRTFDYEWVPGAAMNAVRLGNERYMACPLCHHWSTFNIVDTVIPESPPPASP